MSAVISGNTEVGFVYASLVEFIHLWRSEKDASIKINCKDGQATLSMEFNLGNPDDQHVLFPANGKSSEEKKKKRKKSKSATRTARNNARAARHQAATRPFLPVSPTQPGTATSPVPVTPSRTVTSLAPAQTRSPPPPPPCPRPGGSQRDQKMTRLSQPHQPTGQAQISQKMERDMEIAIRKKKRIGRKR